MLHFFRGDAEGHIGLRTTLLARKGKRVVKIMPWMDGLIDVALLPCDGNSD